MSFRYINPGYVYLLDSQTDTTQLTNTALSKTGVAFTKTNNYYNVVKAPIFVEGDSFWAKYDFYMLENNSFDYKIFLPNTRGIYISLSVSSRSLSVKVEQYESHYFLKDVNIYYSVKKLDCGLIQGAINSVLIHVFYGDSTTAYIDLWLNGKYQNRQSGFAINSTASANTSSANEMIGISANNVNAPISNIIFSDSEIDYRETIIKLPISSTENNMAFDSETGIYTATAANQSLLSAVNVNALADEYGSNSVVTGSLIIGNPAYKTAEGLSSLTAFSRDSLGSVTEYGTYALGSDSAGVIADNQILTGKTIADLQNYKLGWIAK